MDLAGLRRLGSCCGSPDLTVRWYEGIRHEIYIEPEHDGQLGDLRDWLAAHC